MHTVVTKDTPAGTTQIHCPVCGRKDVPGEIIESEETLLQNLVIPISKHTTWWVNCTGCKTKLYSQLSADGLAGKTADQLVGVVYRRVSLVQKFLAIAAVVLSVAPCLGFIMGLIACVANSKSPGWPKALSKLGVLLSVLVHFGLIAYAAYDFSKMVERDNRKKQQQVQPRKVERIESWPQPLKRMG